MAAPHCVTPKQTILSLLPSYRAYLLSLGCRAAGARTYTDSVRRFAVWLDPQATPSDITTALIVQYQSAMSTTYHVKTIHLTLSSIRRFCQWAVVMGYMRSDPTQGIRWPRLPRTVAKPLTPEQLDALHAALRVPPASDAKSVRIWKRNRRVVYLGLYAGLRIGEMANLCWQDVNLEQRELLIREGKGGHQRRLFIADALFDELAAVPVAQRVGGVCGNGRTYSATGERQPIDRKSLAHIFERGPLGELGISAHQLRHTFATSLRRVGADIETIRQALGHRDLETTQGYLGEDPSILRAALRLLPVPGAETSAVRARVSMREATQSAARAALSRKGMKYAVQRWLPKYGLPINALQVRHTVSTVKQTGTAATQ